MEQKIQITNCKVDSEHKTLDIAIDGTLPYPVCGERFRIAAVFCDKDNTIDRHFPMVAHGTVYEKQCTRFHAAARIQLDAVFYEYHPGQPDDIILLKFCTCTPEKKWLTFDTDIRLTSALFQGEEDIRKGFGYSLYQIGKKIQYGFCTILLPLWLLSGYMACHGHGTLHPAAKGRSGKKAIFYHAHGLVSDWTGYGYSIREMKTQYFRKQYEKACLRHSRTEDILFLSERRVEKGGNLDLVWEALRKQKDDNTESFTGEIREFLVNRPVNKLSWKELRDLAGLVAGARVIILEDFYPQLHALSKRPETKILQMWHACGAFKLFGLSDLGIADHLEQDTRNHRSYDAVLASSEGIVPFYAEAYGIPVSHIYPIGVPRTDCFFQPEYAAQVRGALYQKYPVLQGKRVILFAPTFRGSGNKTAYYPVDRFPVDQIMEQMPEDTILVLKNHPFVNNKFSVEEAYRERVLDLSREENINDLLFVTDVLITDYSSVIFEAALLQIPMLFYVFDLEEYQASRDIYFDFASFVPGEMVSDIPGLIDEIQKCLLCGKDFEVEASFREFFLGALDGHSTERAVQLIHDLYQGA
ncbi:MAG: CDP-glycerol glycerophosphotransferase family protein [Eubacteriales bacterium]|nr:CDP-glycerol glycerophosphotransferase family protein [Eubacteriales bacterium]